MKKSLFLIALLFLTFSNFSYVSYAGDLAKDTVWTKETNEPGFSSLQFIKDDQIIVAQAFGQTVFYDAKDGTELHKILGTEKALFFNEEKNFLRLNNDRKRFEIYDTESYQVIGELESDDMLIQEYSSYVISKDENWLVGVVSNGLRVWDLKTKKIFRTKVKEINTSLVGITIDNIDFVNNTTLMIGIRKDYKNNQGSVFTRTRDLIDFQTLDSIGTWGDKGSIFKVSPTGKYIAFGSVGVQIYNLETGEIVSTIKTNNENISGIAFSKDEDFLVTSGNTNSGFLQINEVLTGKQFYLYNYGSKDCIGFSKKQDFIISSSGYYLIKWKVTELMTSVSDDNQRILFPNPTNGKIELKYNVSKPNIFQLEITNLTGQILIRNSLGFKNIGENNDTIDVNNLPLGQYNLSIYSENEQFNFKFIRGE